MENWFRPPHSRPYYEFHLDLWGDQVARNALLHFIHDNGLDEKCLDWIKEHKPRVGTHRLSYGPEKECPYPGCRNGEIATGYGVRSCPICRNGSPYGGYIKDDMKRARLEYAASLAEGAEVRTLLAENEDLRRQVEGLCTPCEPDHHGFCQNYEAHGRPCRRGR